MDQHTRSRSAPVIDLKIAADGSAEAWLVDILVKGDTALDALLAARELMSSWGYRKEIKLNIYDKRTKQTRHWSH